MSQEHGGGISALTTWLQSGTTSRAGLIVGQLGRGRFLAEGLLAHAGISTSTAMVGDQVLIAVTVNGSVTVRFDGMCDMEEAAGDNRVLCFVDNASDLPAQIDTIFQIDIPASEGIRAFELAAERFGLDGSQAAELAKALAPSNTFFDWCAETGITPERLLAEGFMTIYAAWPELRTRIKQAEIDGGVRLFDFGRICNLLEPAGIECSDEWAQLAGALSGRPYSMSDVGLTVSGFPQFFELQQSPSGTLVAHPRSPFAKTILNAGTRDSGSEHRALYHALRERAHSILSATDESDHFIAEQLPIQAIRGSAFSELFSDPIMVLCSDVGTIVREIEAKPSLVLHPGAKAILLAAHRLQTRDYVERASQLELAALRVGLYDFAAKLAEVLPRRPWRALWSKSRPVNSNRTILSRNSPALSIAPISDREGAFVAGYSDGTAWLCHLDRPSQLLWDGSDEHGEIRCVAAASLGNGNVALLGTSDQLLACIDVETGETRWSHRPTQTTPLSAIAIDLPANLVASSGVGGLLALYDLITGDELDYPTYRHGAEIRGIVFVPGSSLIAFCAADGTAGLVDKESGQCTQSTQLGSVLNAIAIVKAETGSVQVVVGTSSGNVTSITWTTNDPNLAPCLRALAHHNADVNAVSVRSLEDGFEVTSASSDQTWLVTTVTSDTTKSSEPIEGHFGPVWALASIWNRTQHYVITGGGEGSCRVWVPAAVCQQSLRLEKPTRHRGAVTVIALHSSVEGPLNVITGGADGEIREWSTGAIATGRPLIRQRSQASALTLAQLDDGKVVVSGTLDGTIRLIEPSLKTMVQPTVLAVAHGGVLSIQSTLLDGRSLIVTGGEDGSISTWDLRDQVLVQNQTVTRFGSVQCLAILAETNGGGVVACGCQDGSIAFASITDEGIRDRHEMGAAVNAISALPNHQFGLVAGFAGGKLGTCRDFMRGRDAWTEFTAHQGNIVGVGAFVLGGRLVVATAGTDRELKLWDLSTYVLLQVVRLDGVPLTLTVEGSLVGVATTAGASVVNFNEDPLVLRQP